MKTTWTDLKSLAGGYRKEWFFRHSGAKPFSVLKSAFCMEPRNRLEARVYGITGLIGSKRELHLRTGN